MLAARMVAVVGLFTAAALLPFLPGRYDPVAGPLSAMSLLAGKAGLLLVPIGAAWLVARSPGARRRLARSALVVASLAWLLGALAAAVHGSMLLGAVSVIAWIVALRRVRGRIGAAAQAPRALPAAVLIVPAAIGALQLSLSGPTLEASRSRAIGKAAALIADIERHRATHGHYPQTLSSVVPDYPVSIGGIDRFRYEPNGDAYNLFFEQPTTTFGLTQIVVYNPRDEHGFASHDMDYLRPDGPGRPRGWFASEETGHPHWQAFLFD